MGGGGLGGYWCLYIDNTGGIHRGLYHTEEVVTPRIGKATQPLLGGSGEGLRGLRFTISNRYYLSPLGRTVNTHVTPFQIKYEVPMEAEVEVSVHDLGMNRAGWNTHLRAKHFKTCMRES